MRDLLEGIKGISYDSRKVMPGDAFFCVKGVNFDGHNYIEDAISRGAAVIVVEKEHEDNLKELADALDV